MSDKTPALVCHFMYVSASLIAAFHKFDVLMEALFLLIIHKNLDFLEKNPSDF